MCERKRTADRTCERKVQVTCVNQATHVNRPQSHAWEKTVQTSHMCEGRKHAACARFYEQLQGRTG
jgi:hypothetical protein